MTDYDLGKVVGSDGATGNGVASVTLISTSGKVKTYRMLFTDGTYVDYQVTDGSDASVTIVTSWNSTTSNSKVPSEKLTKDSLDNKVDKETGKGLFSGSYTDLSNKPSIPSSSSDLSDGSSLVKTSSTTGLIKNDGTIDSNSYLTTSSASSTYQPKLVSGTNIKTINSESILGSGNITIQGGSSVDIVTSWEATLSDAKVPSEKLTKNTIDGKLDNALSSTVVSIASNDDILITDYSDSNKIKRVANILASQVKDGTAHSNIGSSANDTQAIINSDIDTALSNKVSKSSTSGLLKNDGTVDTTSYSTFSGSYNDLSNKPSIPSSSSDLSDGSDLVKKSSTDGVILNDGSIAQLKNIDGEELFSTYGSTDVITFHHYFRINDFFIKKNWDYLNTRPTVDDYGLVWENGGYGLFNFTKNNVLPVEYEFEFRVTATSTISVYVNSTEIIDEGSSGTYTINIVYTNNTSTVKVGGTTVATLNTAITSLALSSQAEFTINGNYVYYDTDFDGCVRSSRVIEETALSNIGTSKGATQSEINSSIDTALGGKQATLVSGTNLKTINNTSLLGSGNIDISGGGSSVDIVTAWESTPSDSKVASEKLTKDTLDTKIAKSSTSGLVKNDGTIDTSAYITSSAISGMLTTSDIANNLTTTTTGKVLDASQGKALADLIGQAITYINQ